MERLFRRTVFHGSSKAVANWTGKSLKPLANCDKPKRDRIGRKQKKNWEELLSQDYDQRLEGYATEIDRLEKAIDEMRAKLEKRREAKSEMIDLRIRVLEAEADDLGWPQHHRGTTRFSVPLAPGQASAPVFLGTPDTANIPSARKQNPSAPGRLRVRVEVEDSRLFADRATAQKTCRDELAHNTL